MFKSQNFCHIASNNRNQVKVGVFVYRTTDSLATVSASGYFNDRIIDINLHDLIIHEKVDSADATKVERNLLCVTERTLENVGTTVIKSKWEGDIETEIATIEQAIENLPNVYVKIDGTSVMTAPLKFAAGSMHGAVGPYLNGVSFWKTDSQGTITNIANLTDSQFWPVTTNSIDLGNTTHTWKDAYVARVITSVLNNGHDIAVPVTNSADTLALKSEVDLAANSGRMITDQGVWYAKMYAGTTAPAAEDGTNYADFSQTDGQGNPIIVIYERQSGAWVQSETITPPAEYDGYVPITSKIWDIVEQAGQQGGRVLWNHQSKDFTPYPQIISFENAALTGVSTAPTPTESSPNNQIANKEYVDNATSRTTYHPDILDWKWADHELNDVQWVRADTFSWQNGTTYEEAYQHLVDDFPENVLTITVGGNVYVRYSANDVPGANHPYCWRYNSTDRFTNSDTPSVGDLVFATSAISIDSGEIDSIGSSVPLPETETIAGITISYYEAADGHKLVLPDQETNVEAIYTATGVAWYYILDTVNQRFKLPRSSHNKYTTSLGVLGTGMALGLTNGTNNYGLSNGITYARITAGSTQYGKPVSTTGGEDTGLVGNYILGVTTDSSKSGMITTTMAQETEQYKYLYFYVGAFTQTALENTAGITAETLNDKVDKGHEVIAFQAPNAGNNYTWYRKYADGWVEQGGVKSVANDTINAEITLPITMQDANYHISVNATSDTAYTSNTSGCTTNRAALWSGSTNRKGTTSFYINMVSNAYPVTWEVKGMAQG